MPRGLAERLRPGQLRSGGRSFPQPSPFALFPRGLRSYIRTPSRAEYGRRVAYGLNKAGKRCRIQGIGPPSMTRKRPALGFDPGAQAGFPHRIMLKKCRSGSRCCLGEPVAQSVEHVTFNHGVVGSSPTGLTSEFKSLLVILHA
jgi:hypothetical protein